mgnify:FL=1
MKYNYKNGTKIKSFTVIDFKPNEYRNTMFLCKCDCGNERWFRGSSLASGKISCKKCHIDKKQELSYLIGQTFGSWTVIGFADKFVQKHYGRNYFYIRCKCTCGTIRDLPYHTVKSMKSASCGCSRKNIEFEFDDLSGRKFGYYTVLSRVENPKNKNQVYKCRCDCGTVKNILRYNLISGDSTSCGCRVFKDSKLEQNVESILKAYNIRFDRNKTFDDLLGINDGLLSYDFYFDNVLIECQGEQHYYPVEHFGGIPVFEKQQEHDRRKRLYAISNNYILIEVPYFYNYDEIKSLILKTLKSENRSVDTICNE